MEKSFSYAITIILVLSIGIALLEQRQSLGFSGGFFGWLSYLLPILLIAINTHV